MYAARCILRFPLNGINMILFTKILTHILPQYKFSLKFAYLGDFRARRTYLSKFFQKYCFLPKYLRFGFCQFKLTLAAGGYIFF